MNESDITLHTTDEIPLCVLKENKKGVTYLYLLILVLTIFSRFCIIIPVLATGDFSAVKLHESYSKKEVYFFNACGVVIIFIFSSIRLFRKAGTYTLYNSYLAFRDFWGFRKVNMPYNLMHVCVKNKIDRFGTSREAILITKEELPDWSRPLRRFKVEFWDGMGFEAAISDPKVFGMKQGTNELAWGRDFDPAQLEKAVQILKTKALSLREKQK